MTAYTDRLDSIIAHIENTQDLQEIVSDFMNIGDESPKTSRLEFTILCMCVIETLDMMNMWDVFPTWTNADKVIVIEALERIVDEWKE